MEDKIFELITKMYSEMTEQFKSVKDELRAEIQSVGNQVTKLEQDHGKKLDALFDGYKQLSEGQEEIKSQLSFLTANLEKQEVEIKVIKGGK